MPPARCSLSSALAALVLLAACGSAPEPTGPPAAAVVGRTSEPPRAPETSTAPKGGPTRDPTSLVEVTAVDRRTKVRRPFVPVLLLGESGRPATRGLTGADGVFRARVAPDFYSVQIATGCSEKLEVFFGGRARIGAVAGSTMPVRLQVEARRRYDAGTPVTWSPEPPWPRRHTVTFTFLLYDRCKDEAAPRISFAEARYRPSASLQLLETATRSGGDSKVRISFRCVRAGDAQLFLEDPKNPSDRTDLLSLRPPPFGGDWCE